MQTPLKALAWSSLTKLRFEPVRAKYAWCLCTADGFFTLTLILLIRHRTSDAAGTLVSVDNVLLLREAWVLLSTAACLLDCCIENVAETVVFLTCGRQLHGTCVEHASPDTRWKTQRLWSYSQDGATSLWSKATQTGPTCCQSWCLPTILFILSFSCKNVYELPSPCFLHAQPISYSMISSPQQLLSSDNSLYSQLLLSKCLWTSLPLVFYMLSPAHTQWSHHHSSFCLPTILFILSFSCQNVYGLPSPLFSTCSAQLMLNDLTTAASEDRHNN
jgi:hypothetical protein